MTEKETQLIRELINTVNLLNGRLESFESTYRKLVNRHILVLQSFETRSNLFDEQLDRFVRLLDIFEKLIERIKTAFMAYRLWEECEEYRKNVLKKKSKPESSVGFDVERKLRRSAR
ncbi:hypothetical protein MYX65_05610 [Acidobacteria bacterium AH-259-L09]|nr:hypothetical protein [Acidobacteria bacterium AH-259-L09]